MLVYMGELNEFLSQHKGERVILSVSVYPKGTTPAIRGYYFKCVVPAMKRAMWEAGERMTNEDAECRLRELSPIMYEEAIDETTGKYISRLRNVYEISNAEFVEHIETIKQLAAEEYGIYIEDPTTL